MTTPTTIIPLPSGRPVTGEATAPVSARTAEFERRRYLERMTPRHRTAPVTIRIAVVEENQLFLDAIVDALNVIHEFDVVSTVYDPAKAVAEVCRVRPNVVVVGLGMDGHQDLNLARELNEAAPYCRVLVIAMRPTRALVDRAVAAGALSVVPTHARVPHLVDAIRGVATGCLTLDPRLFGTSGSLGRNPSLTDREQEILRLTAMGLPTKDIALELFLSPGTVRNLTSALIKKLGGRNRFDAARIARERGWL